jgi:hypothetical protein
MTIGRRVIATRMTIKCTVAGAHCSCLLLSHTLNPFRRAGRTAHWAQVVCRPASGSLTGAEYAIWHDATAAIAASGSETETESPMRYDVTDRKA